MGDAEGDFVAVAVIVGVGVAVVGDAVGVGVGVEALEPVTTKSSNVTVVVGVPPAVYAHSPNLPTPVARLEAADTVHAVGSDVPAFHTRTLIVGLVVPAIDERSMIGVPGDAVKVGVTSVPMTVAAPVEETNRIPTRSVRSGMIRIRGEK